MSFGRTKGWGTAFCCCCDFSPSPSCNPGCNCSGGGVDPERPERWAVELEGHCRCCMGSPCVGICKFVGVGFFGESVCGKWLIFVGCLGEDSSVSDGLGSSARRCFCSSMAMEGGSGKLSNTRIWERAVNPSPSAPPLNRPVSAHLGLIIHLNRYKKWKKKKKKPASRNWHKKEAEGEKNPAPREVGVMFVMDEVRTIAVIQ